MCQSKVLKLLLVIIPLFISASSLAFDKQQPQLSMEILNRIAHNKQKDLWGTVTGIPAFVPDRHSDGCSGSMSATYTKLKFLHAKYGNILPWRSCCVTHDRAYYYGGSKLAKHKADEALKVCVSKTVGDENLGLVLGLMMKDAVRVGGNPYFPTTYRWGYGEDFRGTERLPVYDEVSDTD